MFTFSGENPTTLYYEIVKEVNKNGEEVRPRGRLVKEMRPSSIEYLNPLNRVTFLATRRINPFFQLAESMWINSGRADVEFLVKFNKNMGTFSDDGKWFNAPYGERIRSWGQNSAHDIYPNNTLDQLYDVYKRILEDKDTRQAMMAIGNPSFDNYHYLNEEHGKDIACNLYITFKVRDDKLHMVVFNRSNDVHWGVFGANLCQFSTIQETLCSWLRNSGNEDFKSLTVGTYHQVTDSMHIYIDSYGVDANQNILDYYNSHDYIEPKYECISEPRINSSCLDYNNSLERYWTCYNNLVMDDEIFTTDKWILMLSELNDDKNSGKLDEYLWYTIVSMIAYRHARLGDIADCIKVMSYLPACQWKVSQLYFIKTFIKKYKLNNAEDEKSLITDPYYAQVEDIKNSLIDKSETNVKLLSDYLTI